MYRSLELFRVILCVSFPYCRADARPFLVAKELARTRFKGGWTYGRLTAIGLSVLAFHAVRSADAVGAPPMTVELMAAKPSWVDKQFVGHAFLCLAVPVGSGVKEDCFGFYPVGGKAFIGGPQGIVQSEFVKSPTRFALVTISLKKPITDQQRREVYRMIKDWNSKQYHLTHQSCIDFVDSVARTLDWHTPPRVPTDLPEAYLTKLVNANK
jgi:hypothetical protein